MSNKRSQEVGALLIFFNNTVVHLHVGRNEAKVHASAVLSKGAIPPGRMQHQQEDFFSSVSALQEALHRMNVHK